MSGLRLRHRPAGHRSVHRSDLRPARRRPGARLPLQPVHQLRARLGRRLRRLGAGAASSSTGGCPTGSRSRSRCASPALLSGADRGRRRPPPRGPPRVVGMIATLGLSQLILVMALLVNSDGVSGFTYPEPPHLPSFELQSLPIGTPYVAMLVLAPAAAGRARAVPAPTPAGHRDPRRRRRPGRRPARRHPGAPDGHAGLGDRRRLAAFSAILVTPTTAGAGMEGARPGPAAQGPRRCRHRPDVVDPDRLRAPRSASA